MTQAAFPFEKPKRTYGRITLRGDRWMIDEIEPHVAIRLKQLFPRLPKTGMAPFYLKRDKAIDADVEWFLSRYPLAGLVDDLRAVTSGADAYRSEQAELESILIPDYVMPDYVGLRDGQEVRHYQAQAIELAARSRGLLLGDECGLGKTFTGAGFLLDPERIPGAVVCQKHIQRQWKSVVESFTTLRVHCIRKATPYDLPAADVYIFRYSQIAGWSDVFGSGFFRAVVYDEPQELRTGYGTSKGQAARILSEHAGWRLGLTATPIYNYGSEIWNIMSFLNDTILGEWGEFLREWLIDDGRDQKSKRVKDPKALGTYLRENYAFLRRTKADVGKELPEVNRIVDFVDYDEATVKSVEDLARQLAIKATTGSFVERGKAARDLDIMVRQTTGVAKAKFVADFVRVLVEGGESVLLIGWHRDVYDIWNERLGDLKPGMYTGSESAKQKEDAKNAFVSGETDILIMSLRSAAGLDGLQARCSTIVFGELDWSPGVHHQCIERLNREGQANPVMAIFLVTEEGSDPPMMEVLGIKASEAHQVVDPSLGVQATHSDQGRLQSLVDHYLRKRGAQAPKAANDDSAMAVSA